MFLKTVENNEGEITFKAGSFQFPAPYYCADGSNKGPLVSWVQFIELLHSLKILKDMVFKEKGPWIAFQIALFSKVGWAH